MDYIYFLYVSDNRQPSEEEKSSPKEDMVSRRPEPTSSSTDIVQKAPLMVGHNHKWCNLHPDNIVSGPIRRRPKCLDF